jgi:hypothetical protein
LEVTLGLELTHLFLSLSFHWLEFSHEATPTYKERNF